MFIGSGNDRHEESGGDASARLSASDPSAARPADVVTETETTFGLGHAVAEASGSVRRLYRVADAYLARQATDRPYVVLGSAAAVGFVLGGGLASRVGRALISSASRAAVIDAVSRFGHEQRKVK